MDNDASVMEKTEFSLSSRGVFTYFFFCIKMREMYTDSWLIDWCVSSVFVRFIY